MKKYENDNFIEDQNMDGVDPEYDAAYGSDYDPEGDSAFASEYADGTEYADETGYGPEEAGLEEIEPDAEEEPYYDRKAFKWLRTENRAKFIKLMALLILSSAILIFASIAWFTMNRDVGTSGMGVKTVASPFEIRTSGSAGLYDDYLENADVTYTSGSMTGGSAQNIIWQLTAESQMENLYTETGTPDLREIKKLESDKYGLSPGDHGTLKFTLVPTNGGNIPVYIDLKVSFYKTAYDAEGYQTDTFTLMSADNADDVEPLKYATSHIQFFYKDDNNVQRRITDDGFTVSLGTTEKEVTIYWVWPEKLSNIFDGTIEGLESPGNAQTEMKNYMFANPGEFLSGLSASELSYMTVAEDAENRDTLIATKIAAIKSDTRTYSSYSNKYNNADQSIADGVGYVMVEVIADSNE